MIFLVVSPASGGSLPEPERRQNEKLTEQILDFSRHIAGTSHIKAVCICRSGASGLATEKAVIQTLLIIHDFQPKLMNYVRNILGRNVVTLAVDEWVFERDVDRGLLGESLSWELILPYNPLVNEAYFHVQEVKLKKRLISELLENLVLDFPTLSNEFYIKPEYFMYQALLSRARLFPLMVRDVSDFLREGPRTSETEKTLSGYLEALKELQTEGSISCLDGYVKVSQHFVSSAGTARKRLLNLSKGLPRALFAPALGIFPMILNVISESRESLFKLQSYGKDVLARGELEAPEKYVFIPTASGLVPLSGRLGIEATARKVLSVPSNEKIEIQTIGGILNDVFLIKASTKAGERKLVVKRFRDWSSFKWFPLALWSVGTRTFSILGRSRLERECSMNQFLHSNGFKVPRLLYVNSDERSVFMEYVSGETASKVIKRIAGSKAGKKQTKDLRTIGRVGKRLAKVHALGVALGDTKPENFMIDGRGEIWLMDFEQTSKGGDKVWDVAEFLYYAGHDIPPLAPTRTVEAIANAFIDGYLEAGGQVETVRKAANPKYTKVFSVFTFPHIVLAISNICRKASLPSK
jgi:tRNA A-37 threonylcarbamoyl transferase component Bud32